MSDAALIDHLDAPILVGDPQANAVHVNPAFERSFGRDAESVLGMPLAELFEGGAREAMLRAVASACDQGISVRCRLREKDVGFAAVVSPILREGQGLGVVVLLKEEIEGTERLMALCRGVDEPIEEIDIILQTLIEETGGRRNPGHRAKLEEALRNLDHLQKRLSEMSAVLSGRNAPNRAAPFDAALVGRQVLEGLETRATAREVAMQFLAPASLDGLIGDGGALASALRGMIDARLIADPAPARITLAMRCVKTDDGEALLISISEKAGAAPFEAPFSDKPVVQETLAGLGALVHAAVEPRLGRTTLIRLLCDRA